jgi:hypothetical protein
LKKYFGLLIFIALLGGCTEKGKPMHRHEPDSRRGSNDSGTARVESLEPGSQLNGVSMEQLADRVLDSRRIRDPKSKASRAIREELMALNSMLLKNPNDEILARYAKALATDCEESKETCFGLQYFRQASNSSQVAKLAAMRAKDAGMATRLILSAMTIKNGEYDGDLLGLLLEKSAPVIATATPKTREAVRSMLDSSLILAGQKTQDQAELRALLKRIKVWDLIENPAWDLSGGAQTALWSMAARSHLLPAKGQKGDADYEKFAARMAKDENSVLKVQADMRARNMFPPSAMGAQFIESLDDLNLIVDAVFSGHLPPQSAAQIFSIGGHSASDLAATLENYIRLRFAFAVHSGTLEMDKIMKAGVTTEQLYLHTARQSTTIAKIWGDLYNKLLKVRVFSSVALKAAGGDKEERRLSAMFDNYNHQVNMTSVYPQMLVLFYYLSQKNFNIHLYYGGQINTSLILSYLYFGLLQPQLDYSNEKRPLSHFELLYAFDTAVRTRLFQTVGVDIDDFIANSLLRLTEKPATVIRRHLDIIVNHYQESTLSRDFRNACREFSDGLKVPRQVNLSDMQTSPYYGLLMKYVNKGVGDVTTINRTGELQEVNRGLFYSDYAFAEIVELARLDFSQHIRSAKTMMAAYESYLTKTERVPAAELARRTAKTRALIQRLEALRDRLLKDTAKYESEQGRCVFEINKRDMAVQMQLFKAEAQHLREIHREIKNLREGRPLQSTHEFTGLPSGYKGLSVIDKDGYNTNELDLHIRTALALEKIAPHVKVNFGETIDIDSYAMQSASKNSRRISYVDDVETFVNAGLSSYFRIRGSWLTWTNNDDRVSLWPAYLKSLVSLYRLERDIHQTNNVISPERIVEAQEEFVKLTNIDEDHRDFLTRIKAGFMIDPDQLTDRLYNRNESILSGRAEYQETFGLFDAPAFYMNEERLGIDFDIKAMGLQAPGNAQPRRFGYREYARLYYSTRAKDNRGTPLIPYNPAVDKFLDESLRGWVTHEKDAAADFYKALNKRVTELEALPDSQRLRADVTMKNSQYELFSSVLQTNSEAEAALLMRDTRGCFVRQCDDFQ